MTHNWLWLSVINLFILATHKVRCLLLQSNERAPTHIPTTTGPQLGECPLHSSPATAYFATSSQPRDDRGSPFAAALVARKIKNNTGDESARHPPGQPTNLPNACTDLQVGQLQANLHLDKDLRQMPNLCCRFLFQMINHTFSLAR